MNKELSKGFIEGVTGSNRLLFMKIINSIVLLKIQFLVKL